MRIVGWNIRAGGGRRIDLIAAQLAEWRPDIVALSEFRGTPPSTSLAEAIRALGLDHQLSTVDPRNAARNGLLVASRWPVQRIALRGLPHPRHRVLPVAVDAPSPLSVIAVHGPLGATGLRRPFNDRLLAILKRWRRAPGLLIGDTNTGKRQIDEQSPVFDARDDAWMDGMDAGGWPDAYRHLHGGRRTYTWYSPNRGNGFRLDHAFVHRSVLPYVGNVAYLWATDGSGRRDAVSDHAAIVVDVAY